MPMYEYLCANCGHRFTQLQPMSAARDGHECPECGYKSTRRVMSSFASSSASGGGESGCGPGGGRFR